MKCFTSSILIGGKNLSTHLPTHYVHNLLSLSHSHPHHHTHTHLGPLYTFCHPSVHLCQSGGSCILWWWLQKVSSTVWVGELRPVTAILLEQVHIDLCCRIRPREGFRILAVLVPPIPPLRGPDLSCLFHSPAIPRATPDKWRGLLWHGQEGVGLPTKAADSELRCVLSECIFWQALTALWWSVSLQRGESESVSSFW